MTETDRRILAAVWLPRPQKQVLAAELGLTVPALGFRARRLLADPESEQAEPVLVHHARRVMEQRRAARGR